MAAPEASELCLDTSFVPEVPKHHSAPLDAIKQHVFHEPHGSEAWQLQPDLPTGAEIMVSQNDAEELPHNQVDSVWPSKNAYLGAHYRLVRREGTEALRYAVNKYKSNTAASDDEDMCIYTKVRIRGYLMTKLGPLCSITFSPERAQKKILWQQSRRLMPGSVLAFSTKRDNFETVCMTATVAQRPYRDGLDQDPPQIDIVWGDVNDYVIDPDTQLIMIESRTGYFEAARHTLVGLQMASQSDSPLFKYVVEADQTDALASFVREKPVLDLTSCLYPTADKDLVQWLRRYDVREPTPDIRGQTSLDETQLHALYRMITKELCIVQGPPGTGKTFTSVEALKIILANQSANDPPIIVSAQTNHALDQLLALCLDAGAHIVRVGGRTESDRIAEHTMYNTRQKFGGKVDVTFKLFEGNRVKAYNALLELAQTIFNDGLLQPEDLLSVGAITQEQYDSLVNDEMEQTAMHRPHGPFSLWIAGECIETEVLRHKHCDKNLAGDDEEYNREEYEYEDDFENIADDDEDKDRIHGTFIPFFYKWSGKEPAHLSSWHKRATRELNKADLYAIPKNLRGAVYQLLFARYIEKLKPQFVKCFRDYINCCKEQKTNRWLRDVRVVRQLRVNIVGCTTTGLTKYRGFLAALGAKTMLVEEAAETREANITSALYPSIQQLILVGDHQQLTPFCNIKWLGQKPYYLDMSMFERMVERLAIPYIMLDKQRRMAPEIRAIVDNFYDGLVDHPVALKREPVPGMGDKRTWLFAHDWEDSIDSNHSRYNIEEATMIVNFFAYLVNNGIKQSQITVLTFYKAQRRIILKKLRLHPSLPPTAEPFSVHTVDSYQGEENDIVLLSLVRSPPAGNPYAVGFLDSKNRVIVAISRARRGFYVFGNIVNAVRASRGSEEIWTPIWNAFINQKRYDQIRGLPLQCQPHGKTIWIKNTSEWADNTGGCDQRCTFIRECGHQCAFPCHIKPHDKIRCSQVCGKKLACGHICQIWCKDPCNCLCDAFQAVKSHKETRQMQDEDQMHMDLEELLEAEVLGDMRPKATRPEPQNMQMVLARQAPMRLPPIAQPRNVNRSGAQHLRQLGSPKAGLIIRHAAQSFMVSKPVPKSAGPIVRPPPQRLERVPQRAGHPGLPGVAAYQEFVRDIDLHDRANINARRTIIAQTAGQAPNIRDRYRPVTLVDGRRIESKNPSPEKNISPEKDYSPEKNVTMVRSRSGSSPTVNCRQRLIANGEENGATLASDIDAVISCLAALPTDGGILRRKALSTHSPGSTAVASLGTPGFVKEGFFSDATTVDAGDGILISGKDKPSHDLAMLMSQPPSNTLATIQEQAAEIQPYADLDKWMETSVAGAGDGGLHAEISEQSDILEPAGSAVEDGKGEEELEGDDLLICL